MSSLLAGFGPGQPGEFEAVRRDDVGGRKQPVADSLGDRLGNIKPAPVADHRIADMQRVRIDLAPAAMKSAIGPACSAAPR
jgi:hypothetical protein